MLYTKIQPQSFLCSGEDFSVFLPYMGIAATIPIYMYTGASL